MWTFLSLVLYFLPVRKAILAKEESQSQNFQLESLEKLVFSQTQILTCLSLIRPIEVVSK